MHIKSQLIKLYLFEFFSAFGLAQVIWVVLLTGRGFSLAQVGIAEGFFHLVSFTCEVPSGMLADLLGRKRTMVAACLCRGLACLLMILSTDLVGVCASFGVQALGYNLLSGTREAITYDSLLAAGCPQKYEGVASRQSGIWRGAGAVCALGTGLVALLGWQRAYVADLIATLAALTLALSLKEPVVTATQAARQAHAFAGLGRRFVGHFQQSMGFLVKNPRAACKMLTDGACGCCAYLCTMFLQQQLAVLGLPTAALGAPLLGISLLGALGALLAPKLRLPFGRAAGLCILGVGLGVALSGVPVLALAVLGGAVATLWDSMLEVKMGARLNQDFPSDQRATLISVQSMCFSLLMLPMSPLAGAVCERFGLTVGLALLGGGLLATALAGFTLYKVSLKNLNHK